MVEGDDAATAPLRFPGLEEAERRCRVRLPHDAAPARPAAAGQAGRRRGRSRPRPSRGWRALQESLDDDFNTAEALAALDEALALANRILDGKLDAPKDVRRRTLERLARDLAVASAELGLAEADPARLAGRAPRPPLRRSEDRPRRRRGAHRRAHRRAPAERLRARRRPPREALQERRHRDHGYAEGHHLARRLTPALTVTGVIPSSPGSGPCAPGRRASR